MVRACFAPRSQENPLHVQQDAPRLALYRTEVARAAVDFATLVAAAPLLAHLPRGTHPVLVLPGLLADDHSTFVLRRVLHRLGYRVHGWHLGRNIGPTAQALQGMSRRLDALHERYDQRVSVIGWSLGGIYARDLARENPEAVRQVITLGSPFNLERHTQSRASKIYDRYSHLHVGRRQLPLEAGREPLSVPATSIYTPLDGIVNWRTCLDSPGSRSENIAVIASHLGLGCHPATIWAVADRLAQPEFTWEPFRPPALFHAAFPAVPSRATA